MSPVLSSPPPIFPENLSKALSNSNLGKLKLKSFCGIPVFPYSPESRQQDLWKRNLENKGRVDFSISQYIKYQSVGIVGIYDRCALPLHMAFSCPVKLILTFPGISLNSINSAGTKFVRRYLGIVQKVPKSFYQALPKHELIRCSASLKF